VTKFLAPGRMKDFPSNEGGKEGTPYPLKRRYFAVIGSFSVKTVAHKYRHAAITSTCDGLFRFINIDDLERP